MKIFALLLISIGSAFGQTLNVGTFNVFPITNFPFVTSFQLWAVPITGQSLANGASSTGISTNNYPYDAYTSENGPDQSGIFGGIQLVPSKEKSSAETITTAWMVQ